MNRTMLSTERADDKETALKKNKKTAAMLVTQSQSGDAPKPQFAIQPDNKLGKSENQGHINHRNWSLFLSLRLGHYHKISL